jgi:hypothetical protein
MSELNPYDLAGMRKAAKERSARKVAERSEVVSAPEPCVVSPLSSRICECGTGSCNVKHRKVESVDGGARPDPAEMRKYLVETIDHLYWALDLINMYDRRLIQLGDPKEMVCSFAHINRLSGARNALEGAWQMLNENSACGPCRDGNIPLNGWHKYSGGTHPNDKGDVPCQNQ